MFDLPSVVTIQSHSSAHSEVLTARSRWARALEGHIDDRREALRELASSYYYCAYAWWRRAGLDAGQASTATVASFTRWLGEAPPAPQDSGAGRMREWLPARLAELTESGVELEGEGAITIDPAWAERRFADEPTGQPDVIFQRRWAVTIVEFTAATLRAEYAARGEASLFEDLLAFSGFEPNSEERYAAAAARQNRSGGAMRKAVFDFRTRQREVLRAFAADTVADSAMEGEEITALLCAWSEPGPDAASAPLPSGIHKINPDEVLARALQSVRMTSSGLGGWQPPTREEAARLFPQYEVLSLRGRGGMGAVYEARELELDRLVAIKLLPLEVSTNQDFAERFRREARAMAKLNHPNIIAIYDFGTTPEDHLFFVMEYVDGADLQDMIRGPGVSPALALEIVASVCDALAYAHGKGVVHRDIKPANVMISVDGQVKVADFGLARLTDPGPDPSGHTVTGAILGTPDYMAPEQKHGMQVDHRADIYSLGVMLYEMLCRQVPQGVFDLPSKRVAGVTARIDQVVTKAMAQQPDRRYQSALEMKADAEAARPRARRPSGGFTQKLAAPGGKSKTPLLVGFAVPVVAAALFVVVLNKPSSRTAATPPAPEPAPAAVASARPPAQILPAATPPTAGVLPNTKPAKVVEPDKIAADHPASAAGKASLEAAPAAPVSPSAPPISVAATPASVPPHLAPIAPAPDSLAKPQSEIERWFAQVDGPREEALQKQAVQPFEAGLADLRARYHTSVEAAVAKSSKAGQLTDALAWRAELQAFDKAQTVAADDAGASAGVAALRVAFRKKIAQLDRTRLDQAKALFAPYDAYLAKSETQLTQAQRLDDALFLETKRKEIVRVWLTPSPLVVEAGNASTSDASPAVSPPAPSSAVVLTGSPSSAVITGATKEQPYENSLGMKLVPIVMVGGPTRGQRLLFSIWDTRVQDYQVFVGESKREWPKATFEQGPTHPAIDVSWDDAKAFCAWLTERERKAGKLSTGEEYRLPSDHEWSRAVGLPPDPDATPAELNKSNRVEFPWGLTYPPKKPVGNYGGGIDGYTDGFAKTSPVGSFPANRYGLYDIGGNVQQWCDDWFDKSESGRVFRGACWNDSDRSVILSSARGYAAPTVRNVFIGFRCIIAPVAPAVSSGKGN